MLFALEINGMRLGNAMRTNIPMMTNTTISSCKLNAFNFFLMEKYGTLHDLISKIVLIFKITPFLTFLSAENP